MSRFVQMTGYLALILLCLDAGKLDKLRESKEKAVKVMGDNFDDESKSVEKPIDFKEIGMEMKFMMEARKYQMGGKEEKGKNSKDKLKEFLELIKLSEGVMPNNTRTWICNTLRELRAPEALIVLGNKKALEVMEKVTNLINGTNKGIGPGGNGQGGKGPVENGPGGNGPGVNGTEKIGPGVNGTERIGPGGDGPERNGPGGNGPRDNGTVGDGNGGNRPGVNGTESNGPGDDGPERHGLERNGPGGDRPERNGPERNGPKGNGPGGNGPGGNGPGGNGPENASDRFRPNVVYPSPLKMKERLGSDYSDIIHGRFFYNFMMQYCGF